VPIPVVVDASPLIVLAKTGFLPLLRVVSDPVLVPRPVAQEIGQRGPSDPAAQALAGTSWLQVVDPGSPPPAIHAWKLGAGETAVLTYALANLGTEVVSDDARARRCARALGVPVLGTVAVVLEARRRGAIAAARPVLELLRQAGLYLSDRLMNQALALVGE
jgi:predicted nucleic acid-binding protein